MIYNNYNKITMGNIQETFLNQSVSFMDAANGTGSYHQRLDDLFIELNKIN